MQGGAATAPEPVVAKKNFWMLSLSGCGISDSGSGRPEPGTTPDATYVEIVEIPDHPFFVACQFHPEFKSKPLEPHPLFSAFIEASYANRVRRREVSRVDEQQVTSL